MLQPPPRPSLALSRFFAFSPLFPAPWVPGVPLGFLLSYLASGLGVVGTILNAVYGTLVFAGVLACLVPSRIVVGPDGIEHRWLFWRRFFPLRDVRALERTFPLPACLRLRDGRPALLPYTFSPRNDFTGARSQALLAIDRAIAWAADQPPAPAPPEADRLTMRAGEGMAAWRSRVAGDAYRSEGVSSETLLRIVDDPALSPDVRGAAAIMLAPAADAGTRARIAEVAATTANTKLRVLLDGAVQGVPDEEVASRFDDVAAQVDARARRP